MFSSFARFRALSLSLSLQWGNTTDIKTKGKITQYFKICKLVTAFKAAKIILSFGTLFSFSFNKKDLSIPSVNFFIQFYFA